MEKEYTISWLKILGILGGAVLVIAIICFLIPKKDNNISSNTFVNNINIMKQAGFEYFQDTNLPTKIGEHSKVTLEEMVSTNLVLDIYDDNGKTCDKNNSYIEATKVRDKEYDLKVYLACESKTDYIKTSIKENVSCIDCNIIGDNINSGSNSSSSSNEASRDTGVNNNNNSNNNTSGGVVNNYYNNTTTTTVNKYYNITYINSCKNSCTTDDCRNNCQNNVYYSVYFDSQGGAFVPKQVVKQNGVALYRTTTRDGYKFLGWYLNGYSYDFATPVTQTITLVAKWEKINNVTPDPKPDPTPDPTPKPKNKYTVSFNSNGGTYVNPQYNIEEGNYASMPSNPTRNCYDFAGWYTDSALTIRYNFNTPVTSNMTLHAKWVDNGSCRATYWVNYDSNGGSYVDSRSYDEGDRIIRPSDPYRSGYKFLGWYYNNREFSFNTRIYQNYTLVAKWEKEEEKYNKYCKVDSKRYYSTNYVNANGNVWSKNWTIRFDDLYNVENLRITNIGYITGSSMYTDVYRDFYSKGISLVNGTGKYTVGITSGSMLQTYSLKSSNFTKYLSNAYYQGGKWYTNASISINNFRNVNKYYASNLGYYIYFTPFYFDVEYTNMSNCITDRASNSSRYSGYKVVDTFYR